MLVNTRRVYGSAGVCPGPERSGCADVAGRMNYMAYGQRDSARASFVLASQMCPNRLAPLVGLMRLYDQAGNQAEAEAMAQTILRKPIKIRSVPVLILQEEARAYLRRSSE